MDVLATVKKVDTKIESCSQKDVELSCKVLVQNLHSINFMLKHVDCNIGNLGGISERAQAPYPDRRCLAPS